MPETIDAIITAGGTPGPDDRLYPFTRGAPKALLEIGGRPMIQWVLDALDQAPSIGRIVIVGLTTTFALRSHTQVAYLPNQGSMYANLRAGVDRLQQMGASPDDLVLSVSSDVPAITAAMLEWLAGQALGQPVDVIYGVIRKQVMEARFPGSRRTYARLRDGAFCGSDVSVLRAGLVYEKQETWEALISRRKNVLQQAAMIGFDTLLLFALGLLGVDQAVERVSRRLGIRARALECPYAELGMDIDKPHQLAMLRADLAGQADA